MFKVVAAALILLPCATFAAAPALAPGSWTITSTTVEMSVPGLPRFMARIMEGRTKTRRKRLLAGEGVEALIAPDPKERCHVDVQLVAGGRYNQTLTCPQNRGQPVKVVQSGTYDRTGFIGRATVTGSTAKGSMRIVLDQRAARVGD